MSFARPFSLCRYRKYSANILENTIENDIEKRFFKDQVVVEKGNMVLYANEATHIPSLGQVILNTNVQMHDNVDSLKCDQLILYDKEYQEFLANGNIQYFKDKTIIKSENLPLHTNRKYIKRVGITYNIDDLQKEYKCKVKPKNVSLKNDHKVSCWNY